MRAHYLLRMSTSIVCPPGSYSSAKSSECVFCPAGKACVLIKDSVSETECGSDEYSEKGDLVCRKCPAGFSCHDKQFLLECPPGSFSLANQITCTPCDPGHFCTSKVNDNKQKCELGTFSQGGLDKCLPCPAGHHCKDRVKFTPCDMGTFALRGQATACEPCPAGFYCPRKDHSPVPCPRGTYSQARQTNCVPCPDKRRCPTPSESYLCKNNEYSPPGKLRAFMSTSICTVSFEAFCENIFFLMFAGDTECYPSIPGAFPSLPSGGSTCPAGGYCSEGQFVPCWPGTFNPNTGRSEPNACKACTPGFYCNTTKMEKPFPCPKGYYCPLGTKDRFEFPCPAGTYNPQLEASYITRCLSCPAGKFCPEGSEAGEPCPAGFFCLAGQPTGEIHACPPGTFSNKLNLKDNKDCTQCAEGHYCPDGLLGAPRIKAVPCPAGTFNDKKGISFSFGCRPCPEGRYCAMEGMKTFGTECPAAHYCPRGSAAALQCPPGTFSTSTGLRHRLQCLPCKEGFACPKAGQKVASTPCAKGHFCPPGTIFTKQHPCPGGTFSDKTDLASAEQCKPCTKVCSRSKKTFPGR